MIEPLYMTIEELLEMRVGDVLQEEPEGMQVLKDSRDGKARVILFATGEHAEYLLRLIANFTQKEKEAAPC